MIYDHLQSHIKSIFRYLDSNKIWNNTRKKTEEQESILIFTFQNKNIHFKDITSAKEWLHVNSKRSTERHLYEENISAEIILHTNVYVTAKVILCYSSLWNVFTLSMCVFSRMCLFKYVIVLVQMRKWLYGNINIMEIGIFQYELFG